MLLQGSQGKSELTVLISFTLRKLSHCLKHSEIRPKLSDCSITSFNS